MSTDENKALIRRYFAAVQRAFETGDVAPLDDLFDPDYVERLRVGGPPRRLEGLKQFIHLIRAAVPDASVTVEDVVAEGECLRSLSWRRHPPIKATMGHKLSRPEHVLGGDDGHW